MKRRVLGVGLALALLAGAFALLATVRGGPADGEALLAAWFQDGRRPEGARVVEALELPSGATTVRLEHPPEQGAGWDELVFVRYPAPEAVAALFPEKKEGEPGGGGPGAGGPPRADGEEDDAQRIERWRADPSFAFHTEVHAGRIVWDRWEAELRVERAWLEGGGWQECARVDLAQKGRPLVLFVRWPRDEAWSEADLRALLRRIAMLPPSA